VLRLKIHPK